ncbi:MAG: bifunctional alpha,alpha-trehalose-phosphate synthase (UDP-forming)/trehalose-phosphatase [Polyangiaceae bacterium]|nr:bifunctional alpha,alpha-trehalose-phosphate synthase (UDP-forming)/trehalose-phosphatase [Polyangiaceae bacterium]
MPTQPSGFEGGAGDLSSSRLILVSNRLPISIVGSGEDAQLVPSSGGLVTGLSGPHARRNGLWIGWPGDLSVFDERGRKAVDERLFAMRAVPVHIEAAEAKRFYEGFSNGVLWPLFHYLVDRVPPQPRGWDDYVRVNERFADAVVKHASGNDRIWIHDYQLMLLPGMLRERMPEARIGFFLHIPFPSSEVFRTLPWRERLLEGLLGADLIGFHTFAYQGHFTTSLLRILGIEPEVDRVHHHGRTIRLGVFPMGIDGDSFAKLGAEPDVLAEARAVRDASGGAKLLLGVDRLDYTKGLLRRMLAIERLLEREPEWRGKIRFVQLCVPSRESVDDYKSFRRELEQCVGRINGKYATLHGPPVHYLYRSVSQSELCALYRAADVMLVTPLRDGMNLVAKEFVATRTDGDGVLVLSEFAGAASEMGEAVLTNPYDVEVLASSISRALQMPETERRSRMAVLHERVRSRSVHDWVASFMAALDAETPSPNAIDVRACPVALADALEILGAAQDLVLLLDYDGTLVPFAPLPELAVPPASLRLLLAELATLPATSIHIVSGRPMAFLERHFSDLPLRLHAEHALWSRGPDETWSSELSVSDGWKERVRPIFEEYVARTPGSLLEEKTAGFAWHYRRAEPEFGVMQARELRVHLVQSLAQQPLEIMTGDKVLEVRLQGASKALAARALSAAITRRATIAAFGDDRTDEDLFAALPSGTLSFHIGDRPTRATHRLRGQEEVIWVLERLLAIRRRRHTD